MLYLQLFYIFFKIGLFGFGGGYGMLPLIQIEIVERGQFIDIEQFTNIVAISQITPGPIGINCATFVGYAATGNVFGSFLATFAVVLPSFVLMLFVAGMIAKFKTNNHVSAAISALRLTVIGLIAAAALLLITEESFGENYADIISWLLFAITFAAVKFLKVNPILIILIVGIFGILWY